MIENLKKIGIIKQHRHYEYQNILGGMKIRKLVEDKTLIV